MKEQFIVVNGINHLRYVGIAVKGNIGKVYDFDIVNKDSYRTFKNEEEKTCV